ncbi:YfhO family protein [Metabacillus fastidiosus]|uniref:YfhO family protein n=1 Tax=Metabacillus fastidiosus TaxID=1458 RepID=UPI003D28D821
MTQVKKNLLDLKTNFIMKRWENKTRLYKMFLLFLLSFIIAFCSHLFFLTEWLEGRYMTGIGDGLSQMVPFKQLLYDEYSKGNFFYSDKFGIGGGTYSQLSYYFSTSFFFIATAIITFLLEVTKLINKPDIFYWADALLAVSIIRMTLIIFVTTLYFRYMNFKNIPALVGASLYGTSVIYFRHVTYWEFFADAMLWLPLLLFGIEKIIREKKIGLFTLAVVFSLFNNFYFSYINFVLAFIYIVFRSFISLHNDETSKIEQIKLYFFSGIIGFGMSAVSFVPAVYGFLNNYRPPYEATILLYDFHDNLLLNGKIVILPAFAVLCLFLFSFYKNRLFRLFASLTILLIVLHYSPMVASAFNGFSAPQFRWEYFLSLTAGGVAAAGLQQLHKVKIWQAVMSVFATLILYFLFYHFDEKLFITSLKEGFSAVAAVITIILFIIYSFRKNKQLLWIPSIVLIILNIYIANSYEEIKLSYGGKVQQSSTDFMLSDEYNGEEQRELIKKIQKEEDDPFARIDWMTPFRYNTPIVQEFKGLSVYSSILNEHLLKFYLYDLKINMGWESVSRYGTLGDRANLYSILNGKYYIAEKNKKNIPYGFEEFASTENYTAYKNNNILPFVRTTNIAFNEENLKDAMPLVKEHAMLEGIILKENSGIKYALPRKENAIKNVKLEEKGSSYHNNILDVSAKKGGLDLVIENPDENIKDYYVSFYLKSLHPDRKFYLSVNDFETLRKSNASIYKTNVNDLVIRVPKAEKISIRVPKGKYKLVNLEVYKENYQLLEGLKNEVYNNPQAAVTWKNNKIKINYNNANAEKYMTLPIPFEKGWSLSINGHKQEILQANYAFTGFKLQEGLNEIELTYYPPYFFISLFISCISFLLFIFYRKREYKKAGMFKRNVSDM